MIAMSDPNPLVAGKGAAALRRAGISVTVGVGRSEAQELNKVYRHWMKTGRPYVILKAGMTLDGQLAAATGESQWITGLSSRQEVHQLRSQVDAILSGVGTVLADDPSLTARRGSRLNTFAPRQPLRIVVDSSLRIPMKARILSEQERARTIIATTGRASAARRSALERKKIEVLTLPAAHGRVALPALLDELGRRGVTTLLVEGGSDINAAMLRARLVNHVRLYVAPLLLGGHDAKGMIGGVCPAKLTGALTIRHMVTRALGDDLVVEGEL